MKTCQLGEFELYDSFEKVFPLIWSHEGKRITFELGSNCESWPRQLYNCIQFVKLIEGIRMCYPQIKEKYFFLTRSKFFYGEKTFSIEYVKKSRTFLIKTGLPFNTFPALDYNGVKEFSQKFADYLDSMIWQMKKGLPNSVAQGLLEECQNLAKGIPVKRSLLRDF